MVQARWILALVAAAVVLGGRDVSCGVTNQTKVVEDVTVKGDVPGTEGDDMRVARNFANDQWRAVPQYPAHNNAWTPDVVLSSQDTQPVQKRRRLRKRKRRPQPPVFSITEGESEDIEDRLSKRKQQQLQLQQRPHRLGDMHEPWKEMEEEGAQRSSTRRRISPVYTMVDLPQGAVSATLQVEAASAKKSPVSSTTNLPDLKMLLKQNGGQSLSEILQQRNLSLADLLRGQQEAILALTDRPLNLDVVSEYRNPSKPDVKLALKQVLPTVRKEILRKPDVITEKPVDHTLNKDIIDAQRKRLSVLYNKENKIYSDVAKFDVITEATTEKRIFVPSHPKYYTSIDYRPELEDVSEKIFNPEPKKIPTTDDPQETTTVVITTTPMETTTLKKSLLSNIISHQRLRPKLKSKLPITSAKLMKKATSPMPITTSDRNDSGETIVPVEAMKIDIKDLFGFNSLVKPDVRPSNNKDKGPLKMTIDLDSIIKTTQKTDVDNIQTNLIQDDSTTWTTEMETVTSAEKLRTVSAKDEIMEVLQDEITKEKLTKLLESRNMTIEELVEQRERGSSQRHLADIFHNKTKEPEPVEIVHEGHLKEPMYRPPATDRQPKNTVLQEETSTMPSGNDMQTNESKSNIINPEYGVTSFPSYKIETDKNDQKTNHVPVWKSVYSTIRSDIFTENIQFGSIEATIDQSNDLFIREMQQIDEIENTIQQAVNDEEDRMLPNQYSRDDDEHFNIPYGVKSAIFASLAIIGISLIVFLTILVIFRWMQRHKKRLCYSDSFSCSKSKSPILDVPVDPQHRSLRTMMNETLGRKKNVYKAHLQSMSDSWDSDGGGYGKSYK